MVFKPLTNGLGFTGGSYDEWAPYLISHFGGLCLQTGRYEQWKALQKDWYEGTYLNRNLVFNQYLGISAKVTTPKYLATDSSVFNQYISIPVLWRNYYTLLGYQRNKVTEEIWIEPMLPPEMNHSLKNGFYFSPEGNGTISATESGADFGNQHIEFKLDKPLKVSTIYLRDKSTDPTISVFINDVKKTFTRSGEGYTKKLKIDYSGVIDPAGIVIRVEPSTSVITVQKVSDQFKFFQTDNCLQFTMPRKCLELFQYTISMGKLLKDLKQEVISHPI